MKKESVFLTFLLASFVFIITSCKKEINLDVKPAIVSSDTSNIEAQPEQTVAVTKLSTLKHYFALGANGHPLSATAYTAIGVNQQMKFLKSMGMTWYRIDIKATESGNMANFTEFDALQKAAKSNGISLLPMLYALTLDLKDSEAEAYTKGKSFAANFAAKYGSYFNYYNLGNEMELRIILAGKSGQYKNDYNQVKFKVTAAYLKGMNEGIKSKDPNAKTLVDAGWLHFAYVQMLESYGVKFDILSYHWYADMEGASAKPPYNILDITKKLTTLFPSKFVWFTESNYRYKGLSTDGAKQKDFITNFIAKCQANSHVQVLMFYELLDEPANPHIAEKDLGLIKWIKPYGTWKYTPAGQSLLVN